MSSVATAVRKRLARALPDPTVELKHENPWQLLVATILAAQSTDATINRVTPELFAAFPTPHALADGSQEAVEAIVKPTGFFRNKAKAIRGASRRLVEEHGGEVPRTMKELTALPGVARKTANVVLGIGYGVAAGFVVDTHVGRVSRRLGLSTAKEAERVESDLCDVFPKRSWIAMSHRLVLHGRYVCKAKDPRCTECCLHELCPSAEGAASGKRWGARADAWREEMDSRLAYLR